VLAILVVAACVVPATAVALPQLSEGTTRMVPNLDQRKAGGEFVPGEAIVRFKSGTTASERTATRRAADVEFEQSLEVPRAQLVEVDGDVKAAVRRLERQPDVAFAQPNYRYEALAVAPPNDTFFGDLWGLEDSAAPNPGVDVLEGWESNRGAGQVIAVVDTGVALDHPDIAGNVWTGPGGIHGHDFVDGDSDPDDYNFHGTHVAGTAAAIAGNGLGIAGVAPDAEIMAVRVLDGDGNGSSVDIGNGIAFAAQHGADVINLSLGGGGDSDPFMSSGVEIADGLDAVVVAAAGNDDNDNDSDGTVPCVLPHPNVICVAAVTEGGSLASFSNFGATTVDVGAPGTNILSAETDYAAVMTEDFATPDDWSTSTSNGGIPWALVASPNTDGNNSATDSPGGDYGQAIDDDFYAVSTIFKTTPLSLVGQRGCRMHYHLRYALEDGFDFLFAGARTPDIDEDLFVTGSSGGSFFAEEVSISDMDGSPSASPRFTLLSDFDIELDGVYVDQLRVLCRAEPSPTGDYVEFQGTSMAAPHVAGVAALVRAADPNAPNAQVIQAIEDGGAPLASLAGTTVSGRTADADGAIAAVLGLPNPSTGSSPPEQQVKPPLASPPAKPDLRGAKKKVRVSKRRTFRYSFRATPGLSGEALFRTRKKAVVSRKAHVTVGRKRFIVAGDGRVTVKLKLSKKKLRILRRNGRLSLKVTVTVRDSAGLSSQATKRLTLLKPKR